MTSLSELDLGSVPMVLHSQGNQEKYQNNTMSNFFCELTDPLTIPGAWTMAMNSFDYNTAIINIDDQQENQEAVQTMRAKLPSSRLSFTLSPWLNDHNRIWTSRKITFLFNIDVPHVSTPAAQAIQHIADQFNDEFTKIELPLNKGLMPINTTRFKLKMSLFSNPAGDIDDDESEFFHTFSSNELMYGILRGKDMIDHIIHLLNTVENIGDYFMMDGQRSYVFYFDDVKNKICMTLNKVGRVKINIGHPMNFGSHQLMELLGVNSRYTKMTNLTHSSLMAPTVFEFDMSPNLDAMEKTSFDSEGIQDAFRISNEKPFRGGKRDGRAHPSELLYNPITLTTKIRQDNGLEYGNTTQITSNDFHRFTTLGTLCLICFNDFRMTFDDDDHLELHSKVNGVTVCDMTCAGESYLMNTIGCDGSTLGSSTASVKNLNVRFTATMSGGVSIPYRFPRPINRDLLRVIGPESLPLSEVLRAEIGTNNDTEVPTVNLVVIPAPKQNDLEVYTTTRHKVGWSSYTLTAVSETLTSVEEHRWFLEARNIVNFGSNLNLGMDDMVNRPYSSYGSTNRRFPEVFQVPRVVNTGWLTTDKRARAYASFLESESIHVTKNKVRLRAGFILESNKRQVEIVYDQTKGLAVPGCYRTFDVLRSAIMNLFSNQALFAEQNFNLEDILVMHLKEGVNLVEFRIKNNPAKKNYDPNKQLKLNYVELQFSPHLGRLLGISHRKNKDLEELPIIKVCNQRGFAVAGNTDQNPLIGLGPGVTTTVKERIGRNLSRIFECENQLYCDMGITDMYLYLPNTLQKMAVGKQTVSLLGIVPISNTPNIRVNHVVINPQKRKMKHDNLHDLQVLTQDSSGDSIKFADSINGNSLSVRLEKVGTLV